MTATVVNDVPCVTVRPFLVKPICYGNQRSVIYSIISFFKHQFVSGSFEPIKPRIVIVWVFLHFFFPQDSLMCIPLCVMIYLSESHNLFWLFCLGRCPSRCKHCHQKYRNDYFFHFSL